MLFLHCGWPHTGTSSLQAAMCEHRDRLAAAGVVYPQRWQRRNAHHEVIELFGPSANNDAIGDFQDYLRVHRDQTVLISSEMLTDGLPPVESRGSLLKLLSAAREVVPVTCLWTLRCMAEVLVALYDPRPEIGRAGSRALVLGYAQWSAVLEYSQWLRKLAGMREVDDLLGEAAVYCRYDAGGAHHEELLQTVGVPDPLRSEIVTGLRSGPRINTRVTRKAAISLLFLDAISARAGVEIPFEAVLMGWHDGKLRFAEDSPFVPIDSDVRRAAHEEALKVCHQEGFDPYIEFFEEAEIQPFAPVSLESFDPAALTDDDLERLVVVSDRARSIGSGTHRDVAP
jgi:hypothetical protein